jgi:hypothetical protein
MTVPSLNTNIQDILPLDAGEIFTSAGESAVATLSSIATSIRLVGSPL